MVLLAWSSTKDYIRAENKLQYIYSLFIPQVIIHSTSPPLGGAGDTEIKVLSGENTELKRSPFKAWSRSV